MSTMPAVASIPYEKQSDLAASRTCGAACLSMVYRSFGRDVPQSQIWPAIAKKNRFGSVASTTHLMVQDALSRGFAAVAIQARHPLQVLRLCRDFGIRGILNHRLKQDVATGHYSVLVDIDDRNVILHDPLYGPARRLPHEELLSLWRPRFSSSEIVGNLLIGITAEPAASAGCQLCRTPISPNVQCPRCKIQVGLAPVVLLGCLNSSCIGRMWNYLCCPSCDYMWSFSLRAPEARAPGSVSTNGQRPASLSSPLPPDVKVSPSLNADPLNLGQLFGQIDQFCGQILSFPAAASDPEIKQQLDFIAASKEKLTLALAEQRAHRQARQEQLANLIQAVKEKQEAHRKRIEKFTGEYVRSP